MSANNAIFINRETLRAYYVPCLDNDFDESEEMPIAEGKNLDELVDNVEKWLADNEMDAAEIEFGVRFI